MGARVAQGGPYELLAERHVRHLANEHKLCKTPANKCTLTLLPFDLKLYKRTSLERDQKRLAQRYGPCMSKVKKAA
jgi:hypothetical protein